MKIVSTEVLLIFERTQGNLLALTAVKKIWCNEEYTSKYTLN
jgi:hypothetical protein